MLTPYGSIITRILKEFHVPFWELVFDVTKKLGGEAITALGFYKRRGQWGKTSSVKNQDTFVAAEDDLMLNNIYMADELPDFRLGARAQIVAHPFGIETSAARASAARASATDMDTKESHGPNEPSVSEHSM